MSKEKNTFPLVLKATAVVTALAAAVLALLFRAFSQGWMLTAAISLGTTCYHFAMRLLVGLLVPMWFRNRLDHRHWWFHLRKWEPTLYRVLKVKRWKNHTPTYDPSQFSLADNTLEDILHNTCSAELVHEVIILYSFLPILLSKIFGEPEVFCITSTLAAMFDGAFVAIQRYNRPRLVRILEKQEAKHS